MSPVFGNLKTNKFTLQENGVLGLGDLVMEVKDNAFNMSMGSNLLMTVAPDEVGDVTGVSSQTNSVLTIVKDTVIQSNLEVVKQLKVGNNIFNKSISSGFKTAVASYIDAHTKPGTWGQEYSQDITNPLDTTGSSIVTVGAMPADPNQWFTPVAHVHVWKNGESWSYGKGKQSVSSTCNIQYEGANETIYYQFSMTKTVTALLYARLCSTGIIPGHDVAFEDVFPCFKDIHFCLPSYSDTSNMHTVGSNADGKWVNVTPTTRKLYLEDVLSESVGFAVYYTGLFNPDAQLQGGFYPEYYDAINIMNSGGQGNGLGLANSNMYHYYEAPIDSGFQYPDPTRIVYPPDYDVNTYFTGFSNQMFLQCSDHGIMNYNSSTNFGTAAMMKLYNDATGSNLSYGAILQKELLGPIGANLFTYFDSPYDERLDRVASCWSPSPTGDMFVTNEIGFDVLKPIYTGFTMSGSVVGADANGPIFDPNTIPQNYNGTLGIFGTLSDFSKIGQLIASHGLDSSGRRIIRAQDIANIMIPRTTINEYSHYTLTSAPNGIHNWGTAGYGLGGVSRGPTYANAYAADASIVNMETLLRTGIVPCSNMAYSPNTLHTAPKNEFGWFGIAGTGCIVCPEENMVTTWSTMCGFDTTNGELFQDLLEANVHDEYFGPVTPLFTA